VNFLHRSFVWHLGADATWPECWSSRPTSGPLRSVAALPDAPVLHDNDLIHRDEGAVGKAIAGLWQCQQRAAIEWNAVAIVIPRAGIAGEEVALTETLEGQTSRTLSLDRAWPDLCSLCGRTGAGPAGVSSLARARIAAVSTGGPSTCSNKLAKSGDWETTLKPRISSLCKGSHVPGFLEPTACPSRRRRRIPVGRHRLRVVVFEPADRIRGAALLGLGCSQADRRRQAHPIRPLPDEAMIVASCSAAPAASQSARTNGALANGVWSWRGCVRSRWSWKHPLCRRALCVAVHPRRRPGRHRWSPTRRHFVLTAEDL